jgi:hypothetical protein
MRLFAFVGAIDIRDLLHKLILQEAEFGWIGRIKIPKFLRVIHQVV